MGDFFDGLGSALGESGSKILDAATQLEIAKLNAKSRIPPPNYYGGGAQVVAPGVSRQQKLAEVTSSPFFWLAVLGVFIGGGALLLRR